MEGINIFRLQRNRQSLFVGWQCQVQPEALREFHLKELGGTFTRGHVPSFSALAEYFSERVSVRVRERAHQLSPPVALLCHPTLGARSSGRGWSTM